MKTKEENEKKMPVMNREIIIIETHLVVLEAEVDPENVQVGRDQEVVVEPEKRNPVQGLCTPCN